MTTTNTEIDIDEATACLRVLVAVAKADGTITEDEWSTLAAAVESIPNSRGLQAYVTETVDLDRVLADIKSRQAREQLWQSAYSMVNVDGAPSRQEQAIVDRIGKVFEIEESKVSATRRVLDETKDTLLPSNIEPISDPAKRAKEIDQDLIKYAVLSAVLGAFPVPGIAIATDLAIVALQVKLVRDVGQYWGHKVDRDAAKTLLAGLGLGTGARIAVANIAKLVPVWGSAFGAASAFATTWALGRIANRYFEAGRPADLGELRAEMKSYVKAGKAAFAENKAEIDAKRDATAATLASLNEQRKAGKLDQAEYERQVAALAT